MLLLADSGQDHILYFHSPEVLPVTEQYVQWFSSPLPFVIFNLLLSMVFFLGNDKFIFSIGFFTYFVSPWSFQSTEVFSNRLINSLLVPVREPTL